MLSVLVRRLLTVLHSRLTLRLLLSEDDSEREVQYEDGVLGYLCPDVGPGPL